jgi:hypothetical protein
MARYASDRRHADRTHALCQPGGEFYSSRISGCLIQFREDRVVVHQFVTG